MYIYSYKIVVLSLSLSLTQSLLLTLFLSLLGSRSALEVMRLVELLLVLVMEGRKALPKTSIPAMVAKRMESFPGDRSHRLVIEAIRAGNNEEFFESMETGFDVNFMDDVGQTLLNWAAAFGTYEMVCDM